MTKRRAPLTVEEALDRAIGNLTMSGAVEATGRKAGYLRVLTDPDRREALTVIDMIKLDTAHLEHDGTTPLLDTVTTILNTVRTSVFADAAEVHRRLQKLMRENAEAELAMAEISQPDADDDAWARAEKELSESVPEATAALAFVRHVRAARAVKPP